MISGYTGNLYTEEPFALSKYKKIFVVQFRNPLQGQQPCAASVHLTGVRLNHTVVNICTHNLPPTSSVCTQYCCGMTSVHLQAIKIPTPSVFHQCGRLFRHIFSLHYGMPDFSKALWHANRTINDQSHHISVNHCTPNADET